jgi:hypothetical protein
LPQRVDRPFKIVQKINDNAYKVKLSGTYGVSTTVNAADLLPGESSVQPGEDDTSQDIEPLNCTTPNMHRLSSLAPSLTSCKSP